MLETSLSFITFRYNQLLIKSKLKKMEKVNYVLRINDRVVTNFNSKEKLVEWFKEKRISKLELSGVSDEDIDEGWGYELEEGINLLIENEGWAEIADCYNIELCERGDDYCTIQIDKINKYNID